MSLFVQKHFIEKRFTVRAMLRSLGYQFDGIIRNAVGSGAGSLCKSDANMKITDKGVFESYEFGEWLITSTTTT